MNIFRKLWLYYNTLKFLKINQLYSYPYFYFKKFIIKRHYCNKASKLFHLEKPEFSPILEKPYLNHFHNISAGSYKFLNKRVLFGDNIDWNDQNLPKLWLYNLHYFDFLLSINDQDHLESLNNASKIIIDWIKSNPVGYKNGWESFPLSLRIVNWIYFFYLNKNYFKEEVEFKDQFLDSLYKQCSYLTFFLEHHLQANHLLKNGKALLFGGYFFNNNKWIQKGEKIVYREIEVQILSDGGHFELSPMYHSIVLEDMLDILNLLLVIKPENSLLKIAYLKSVIQKMITWLNRIIHPDADIPLFGDSAFSISLKLNQLGDYYKNICKEDFQVDKIYGATSLAASGYYMFRSSEHFLIIKGGNLGANYQPGHAHCDLLSFEYSYRRKRFIVDSGPGEYLNTNLRQKARSIYGHNSVVINGLEQAEIWQAFRMGRRVFPNNIQITNENTSSVFIGSYENNLSRLLSYDHKREVRFIEEKYFVIKDSIETRQIKSFESLIHLNRNCHVESVKNALRVTQEEDTIYIVYDGNCFHVKLDDWTYTPEFGHLVTSQKLIIEPKDPTSKTISYIISPEKYFDDALPFLKT